ncbi:MAG: cupredoxin domain-containing protein [Steroidobacteraceae bacterium]
MALILGAVIGRNSFAAPAAQSQVTIKNYAFSPAKITIAPGTTVVWVNQDGDAHTVTSSSGPEHFQSPGLENGDKFSFTFKKAGSYQYVCSVHPFMHGTIIVR